MSATLEALQALTPRLKDASLVVKADQSAKEVLEKLQRAQGQADRFRAWLAVARQLDGLGSPRVSTAVSKAAWRAREAGEALTEAVDGPGIQAAASEFAEFSPTVAAVEVAVREVWAQRVRAAFEPLRNMGELLQRIEDTRQLGLDLNATVQKARASTDASVSPQSLLSTVNDLLAEHDDLSARLKAVSGDEPDVDAFLQALARNQATLRLLTPTVMDWLDRHEALGAFTIQAAD